MKWQTTEFEWIHCNLLLHYNVKKMFSRLPRFGCSPKMKKPFIFPYMSTSSVSSSPGSNEFLTKSSFIRSRSTEGISRGSTTTLGGSVSWSLAKIFCFSCSIFFACISSAVRRTADFWHETQVDESSDTGTFPRSVLVTIAIRFGSGSNSTAYATQRTTMIVKNNQCRNAIVVQLKTNQWKTLHQSIIGTNEWRKSVAPRTRQW